MASHCHLWGLNTSEALLEVGPVMLVGCGAGGRCIAQKGFWGFSVGFRDTQRVKPQPCAPPALLEANGNLSCRCAKTTRAFISPRKYSSIEVRPVGSSCRRLEVV